MILFSFPFTFLLSLLFASLFSVPFSVPFASSIRGLVIIPWRTRKWMFSRLGLRSRDRWIGPWAYNQRSTALLLTLGINGSGLEWAVLTLVQPIFSHT